MGGIISKKNNHDNNDQRNDAQKAIETSLGLQLMITRRVYVSPTQIEMLAIGHFRDGEFQRIADLTVCNLLGVMIDYDENLSPSSEIRFTNQTNGGNSCDVHIDNISTIYKISQTQLDKHLIGKCINANRYGLESEMYVVSEIWQSTDFELSICDGFGKQPIQIKHYDSKDNEKIWGYGLKKYKIDRKGCIQHSNENKIVF